MAMWLMGTSKFVVMVSTSNGAPPISDDALIGHTPLPGISTSTSRGMDIAQACPPTGSTRNNEMLSALWVPRSS